MSRELELREQICEAGRRLWQQGLVAGNEGNLSVRLDDHHLICTPSGISKGHMRPSDLVLIDREGRPMEEGKRPTSEIRIHLRSYNRRPDCNAVVHAHPPTATGFSIARVPIPTDLTPEAGWVLGRVAMCGFGMPGTDELPDSLEPFLPDHKVFLLANHGAMTLGSTIEKAEFLMESLEQVAKIVLVARQLGDPVPMPEEICRKAYEASLNGGLD